MKDTTGKIIDQLGASIDTQRAMLTVVASLQNAVTRLEREQAEIRDGLVALSNRIEAVTQAVKP
jgi:protein-arginine kinase activator protein McsA